ncbi:hypothetical protein BDV93DRAFT_509245 [Ceratobasidium sp. AG-I]|nr:hypothetical protein BDV93DRAFT_509245 [Ceratobasidium sp. AG-I]
MLLTFVMIRRKAPAQPQQDIDFLGNSHHLYRLDFGAVLTRPTTGSFPNRRPLTWLSSDTTFACLLVPLSDSNSEGSEHDLDLDGDSIIWDFGNDMEIHDADPDEGQDISILEGVEDADVDQSWHTAPPFTPGDTSFSSIFLRNDIPAQSSLTRTPSTRPTSMTLKEMQPPKAKRRSLDYLIQHYPLFISAN